MGMSVWKSLLAVAVLALAIPSAAVAEDAIAPPGNSAVDQYRETLPAPGGGRLTDSGRKRSAPRVIGKQKTKKLERYGEDGAAVVDLVAETAPGAVAVTVAGEAKQAAGEAKGAAEGVRGLAGEIENESTSSALAEIAGQATGADGSGGIGWLLPLIVVLTAVGAVAYGLGRRGARR